MQPPERKIIEEWFEFGQSDFECAEFLLSQGVFPEQAMERLQQAELIALIRSLMPAPTPPAPS